MPTGSCPITPASGTRVWWTHRDGMIEVRIDRHGCRVQAWREQDSAGTDYSVRDPW